MVLAITNVSPNTGLTQGREFVLITGTDFNIAVDSNGVSRMTVTFGTVEATRVRVRSVTELDCLTPILDQGQIDVIVDDLDAVTSDTLINGYTFQHPEAGGGTNSDLWRVVETLVLEMKRQILDEVVLGGDVDYDGSPSDGLDIIQLAQTPALILDGPRVMESGGPLHRIGEEWEEGATDEFTKMRPQDICNLEFQLSGVDDHKIRLLNILRDVLSFFRRNNVLKVLINPAQPGLGFREIPMRPPFPQDWRVTSRGDKRSLKYFTGFFTLWGVPIGYGETIDETRGIDDFSGFQVLPL